jgi:hypothetical protein
MNLILHKRQIIFIFLVLSIFSSQAQNIYTFAGTGFAGYSGDGGPANMAQVGNVFGMATDKAGNVYFVDNGTAIRKVNTSGIITTISGAAIWGFAGDGGPAASGKFYHANGICIDTLGNIYIADWGNNRIRKINTSGIISTIAGTGTYGYSGDGGSALSAQIGCSGIAVDHAGNIYFTGYNCIRKIDASGIITTVAGNGLAGYSGDGGPSISAELYDPEGITIDGLGNIYFSDLANYRIRKISSSGIITTVAGNGTNGNSGDGGPAMLAQLYAFNITNDALGNLYFTSGGNLRKVSTAGIISRFAGNGIGGYSGDGGPATSAQVAFTYGITSDAVNNIYFSQQGNANIYQCLRVVCQNNCIAGVNELSKNDYVVSAYPNPNNGSFTLKFDNEIENGELILFNSLGQQVHKQKITQGENSVITNDISKGLYHYTLMQNKQQVGNGKLVVE